MKVIIILDQIQAGLGGKEKADTPLGGKRLAMGAADTIEKILVKQDSEILGTFYCGTEYYANNKFTVQNKVVKMCQKMQPDVVILGPAYDYQDFSRMACELAVKIQTDSNIPVVPALALEKNQETIEAFKNQLTIVKMPKKGGVGLSDSIDNIIQLCQMKVEQTDVTEFATQQCY